MKKHLLGTGPAKCHTVCVFQGSVPYVGSIWSGRFKSTLVEDGRYLATCIRYVELNPVRAGMVTRADAYAYSSASE